MLISRGLLLGRALKKIIAKNAYKLNGVQSLRESHAVAYRVGPAPHSKATLIGAEVVGAMMWWWVLWHLWHEPDHITGEFPYPDTKLWSNKDLGIPPD